MVKATLNLLENKEIKNFNLLGHSMGGMIVQEMTKLVGEKILKLICYGTGPRRNIPRRFETIDQSREKLKLNGLEATANRIAKSGLYIGRKQNIFIYVMKLVKKPQLKL